MLTLSTVTLFVSLALLSHRLLFEPTVSLQGQSSLWIAGCSAMTILIVGYAAVVNFAYTAAPASSPIPPDALPAASSDAVPPFVRLRWIALSAVPFSLMLGVTTYASTEIATVPLFWIIPLTLYLATFIVAFVAGPRWVQPIVNGLLPLTVLPLVLLLVTRTTQPAFLLMPLHVLAFVVLALGCHHELLTSRPHTAHRTEYYLWISVGGLLGVLFNIILAPLLFVSIAEYPIAIVAACLLRVAPRAHHISVSRGLLTVVAAGALTLIAGVLAQRWSLDSQMWMAMLGVALVVSFSISRHAKYFAAAIAVMIVAGLFAGPNTGDRLYAERTFFGVYGE
jgi:hypothetical protein